MRGDLELDAEVAVAEHLDRLALADGAGGDELVDADRPALGEQLRRARPTLTTWYSTRKRFLKPLSFGSRMWIGIWPPSNPAGTW